MALMALMAARFSENKEKADTFEDGTMSDPLQRSFSFIILVLYITQSFVEKAKENTKEQIKRKTEEKRRIDMNKEAMPRNYSFTPTQKQLWPRSMSCTRTIARRRLHKHGVSTIKVGWLKDGRTECAHIPTHCRGQFQGKKL